MARCGSCGADNEAGNRFCGTCGAPLAVTCPACGEPVGPGNLFCGKCGTAVASPAGVAASSPGAAAVAERRVCSVLFVDLVGFTPLSEGRDPEAVRELLSRYFEVARTVIGRYGGTVEKFIGDAVMAVWGTPVATEGDAERAVRAGLELVAEVAVLGAQVGAVALAARGGVVTGEVAVTIGATGEGMVAGDAVNTAARVQGVAAPGTVWVDGATRRLASVSVSFEDAGEHALKGKATPEELWQAVRVISAGGGAQRVDGLEAPLAGRDTELRTIKDLFHASAERRRPRLVVVSGEAGVGKSRLGWEFEKYVDGLADTVLWHRGRCLSYGEGVAFWALAEIVRQRFGIAEEDSAEVAGSKLAEGLVRFVPDPTERTYVGARLGRLLGVGVAGDDAGMLPREELFAGWRVFFERLAGVAPVVLLIEDAHYADPGLLDFVDHLTDWVRDLPVFVVMFGRLELVEGRPGFGAGRNRATLTVDPLDAVSMGALLEALVPGMATEVRSLITAQARGVPLFAVETVRSLIDHDIVVPVDGVHRLVGDIGTLSVPDSLHALFAARLDALDPGLRALVADAAVVGSTFPAEALIAASGHPESDVRAALSELVRRDVFEVSADPLSPQRGTYRFGQDMLRQVAYDTLSRRDRKTRHLAVATHLRGVFANDGEEVAEVVARHYLDAVTAGGPDDPDVAHVRGLATAMLVRAAERALRAGAPRPAAASYAAAARQTEAGSTTEATVTAAGLWEHAAEAARDAYDLDDAVTYAESARDGYAANELQRAAARAETISGSALSAAGRFGEARKRVTVALVVLRPAPDADTVGALNQLARIEVLSGGVDAERLSVEAIVLGQSVGVEPRLLGALFGTRSFSLNYQNRLHEAIAHLEYALRLAEQAGDSEQQAFALGNLSDLLARTDTAAAAATAHAAAGHARRVGHALRLAYAIGNEVAALLFGGEWDEADRALSNPDDLDRTGDQDSLAFYRSMLAALRGDRDKAIKDAGLPGMRASEDIQELAITELCDAFVALASSRLHEALRKAGAAVERAPMIGISNEMLRWAWPLAARTAHDLGATEKVIELLAVLDAYPSAHLTPLLHAERDLTRARLAATNNDPDSGDAYVAALAALRRAASPYHLAHGLLDHAQHHIAGGGSTAAAPLVEEACSIAERLRCQPLIDRVASLTAGSEATVS